MNIFRFLADLAHVVSIFLLLAKIRSIGSVAGLSFRSQCLYLFVYLTRYLDLFHVWLWPTHIYMTLMKFLFIGSSGYTVYLMVYVYKDGNPNYDSFKSRYLLGLCAVLALLFPYKYTVLEVFWTFSIFLESVAILPQLFMLRRTGKTDNITQHYIFALGLYRALYIPNWIYRYYFDGYVDPIAWVAGLVQTGLYVDFFRTYYQKLESGEFKLPV